MNRRVIPPACNHVVILHGILTKSVVDTSFLVAGVSGFRDEPSDNSSAALIAAWTEAPTFVWLLTEEIVSEYVEVLERLQVRSARTIVGRAANAS